MVKSICLVTAILLLVADGKCAMNESEHVAC